MNLDETGQDESKDKEKNAPNKQFPLTSDRIWNEHYMTD